MAKIIFLATIWFTVCILSSQTNAKRLFFQDHRPEYMDDDGHYVFNLPTLEEASNKLKHLPGIISVKSFFSNLHNQFIPKTSTIVGKAKEILNKVDSKIGRMDSRSSRKKRSLSGTLQNNVTSAMLNDNLRQMIIHWAGKGNPAIVVLTKDADVDETATKSNVYFSYDYGVTFQNKNVSATISKFYHSASDISSYIFVDVKKKRLYTTRDMGRTIIQSEQLRFEPSSMIIHPDKASHVLGHDKDSTDKALWLSTDFGATWKLIQRHVKHAYWPYTAASSYNIDSLYVERKEPSGKVSILRTETYFEADSLKEVLISNVEDFAIRNDSLFATRSGKKNGDYNLLIAFSSESPFVVANFPTKLPKKEFFVVDAADKQIMVLVSHQHGHSDLYISEPNRVDFTFSLASVTYYNPDGVGSEEFRLSLWNTKRFADIHKVHGLRSIFIANVGKVIPATGLYDPVSMKTMITFDKGAIWEKLSAPRLQNSNEKELCKTSNCSLHLTHEYNHATNYGYSKIMSQPSAPGYILATGNVGTKLDEHVNIYFSSNGGKDWAQIRLGNHFYTWSDHGAIIATVEKSAKTNKLFYSKDEGKTWSNITFYKEKISVYGLMTEPGEMTTIFTIFGATNDNANSWIISQVDLMSTFVRRCYGYEYRTWSPSDEHGIECLLGSRTTFERKSMSYSHNCYNGRDFDRPTRVRSCHCTRLDYECDMGFHLPVAYSLHCVRDPDSGIDPYEIPPNCRSGQMYKRTRGYRKLAGDQCHGGETENHLGSVDEPCPWIEESAFILVTSSSGISRIDLSNEQVNKLPISLSYPSGISNIDFEYASNCVYFTENVKIRRFCLNGTVQNEDKIIVNESQNIMLMTFDWESRNMFWVVEGQNSKFKVMNLDTRYSRVLSLNSSLVRKPTSLVVYPQKGIMYYIDKCAYQACTDTRIIRADLDGTNAVKLYSSYYSQVFSSLVLDTGAEKLYFITTSYNTRIVSMNLDGSSRRTLHSDNQMMFLDTFKNFVYYWRRTGDIQSGDKFVFERNHTVALNLQNVGAFKLIRRSAQFYLNKCGNKTSGCPFLCMPLPSHDKVIKDTCLCDNINFKDDSSSSSNKCTCRDSETMVNGRCEPSKDSCRKDQFKCRNGKCIPAIWKCDQGFDCDDHSDEDHCPYNSCPSNYIPCTNSSFCIEKSWSCDGVTDCVDESDEKNCAAAVCNATDHFRCDNGMCILETWHCDEENDCGDFSDEKNCTSVGPETCEDINALKCQTKLYGNRCVPTSWLCDGETDCTDNSDEKNCSSIQCDTYHFQCTSKQCIFLFWRCDGDKDCTDGSDEENCSIVTTTTSAPTTTTTQFSINSCSRKEFECYTHHTCIPVVWKCDGANDCGDHSDEFDCPDLISVNSSSITYECFSITFQFRCNNHLCVPFFLECNGFNDCGDWSDERHCPGFSSLINHPSCISGSGTDYTGTRNYTKSGKTCQKWSSNNPHRPHYWPADSNNNYCRNPDADVTGPWCYTTDPKVRWEYCGIPHCRTNGTRPSYVVPTLPTPQCNDGHFTCGVGAKTKCVPKWWTCDGEDDCGNNEDEKNCDTPCNKTTMFQCNNGRCISKTLMCNGLDDCLDFSDELLCATFIPSTRCMLEIHFKCADGKQCIPKTKRCDDNPDCVDKSDEQNCKNSTGGVLVQCKSKLHSIKDTQQCDWNIDCPDKSDEQICYSHTSYAWVTTVKPVGSKCKPSRACVTVAWSKPVSMVPKSLWPNSSYVISYQFVHPADAGLSYDSTKSITAKLDETTAVISDLEFNRYYQFKVDFRINGVYLPGWEYGYNSTYMTPEGKPTTPGKVVVQSFELGSVNLIWKPSDKVNGILRGYYIRISNATKSYNFTYFENCDHRCSYSVNVPKGNYNVSVRLRNSKFVSDWSERTEVFIGLVKVSTVTIKDIMDSSATVQWTLDSHITVIGFKVRLSADSMTDRIISVNNTEQRELILTKLQPGTTYELSIAVVIEEAVTASYSKSYSLTVKGSKPLTPMITKCTPTSTRSITLTWKSPHPMPKNFNYKVSWNVDYVRTPYQTKRVNCTNSTIITNLPINEEQIFEVRVIEPYLGITSDPFKCSPKFDPTEAPRHIHVTKNDNLTSATISWMGPTSSGLKKLTYRIVVIGNTKIVVNKTVTTDNPSVSTYITGLLPGTTYEVMIVINTKDAIPNNVTFHTGKVPGPRFLYVHPFSETCYVAAFEVPERFKKFYHNSVLGIKSWICDGKAIHSFSDPNCTALADVGNSSHVLSLVDLKPNHWYTGFLEAHCAKDHECGTTSYVFQVNNPETYNQHSFGVEPSSSSSSFPLTPTNIAAVIAPVVVLLSVLVGIIVYMVRRNRRLSAAYNGFVASHYDPQSGEAIFVSNSDDDNGLHLDDDAETPLITGFADDEPLIVA